jgi:hypothetical protein
MEGILKGTLELGDGWSDIQERKAGTDPREKLSFPLE